MSYPNGLVVFFTFFNLTLNFAIRSSCSESHQLKVFFSADCIELLFGCKEHNQSDFGVNHLVMSMCRVITCVVGKLVLLLPVCSLGKILLAFVLLHFVLQGQTCLLFQIFLNFILLHSNPLWWNVHLFSFLVLLLESLLGLHRTGQLQLLLYQ